MDERTYAVPSRERGGMDRMEAGGAGLTKVPSEGRLVEFSKRFYDFQDRLAGHRNNLHAVADRLGGVVAEPSAGNGREVPRPEPNGIVHSLETRLEEINILLEQCGNEMERLRQL